MQYINFMLIRVFLCTWQVYFCSSVLCRAPDPGEVILSCLVPPASTTQEHGSKRRHVQREPMFRVSPHLKLLMNTNGVCVYLCSMYYRWLLKHGGKGLRSRQLVKWILKPSRGVSPVIDNTNVSTVNTDFMLISAVLLINVFHWIIFIYLPVYNITGSQKCGCIDDGVPCCTRLVEIRILTNQMAGQETSMRAAHHNHSIRIKTCFILQSAQHSPLDSRNERG